MAGTGPGLRRFTPCLLTLGLTTSPVAAQVVLDGSAGPAGALAGPDYAIGAELGRLAGRNLFHSFARFSLTAGESATFSGPSGIANVIGRVTGGERSDIDGTLRSTIPGADFWFLNPAGVVFGPNARLDLRGSFHVSTADELRFKDGARLSATDPTTGSTFTVAPPEAFGFLGPNPLAISVDGGTLELASRETLSLIGGDIDVAAGSIVIPQGRLNLVAKASGGQIRIERPEIQPTGRGDITIAGGSVVDLGGFGSGLLHVRARTFTVDGAEISANNGSDLDATGGIDIEAAEVAVRAGGRLRADAFGAGRGGRTTVVADQVEVGVGGLISASTFGEGGAGAVSVTAGELHIRGGVINSITEGPGPAGTVNVDAHSIAVSDTGWIQAASRGGATGAAGHVVVRADEATILGRSAERNVSSGLFADGADDAGTVRIEAGRLTVGDGGTISASGRQGTVEVTADELMVTGGGTIQATTSGRGNAGGIRVEADTVVVSGVSRDSAGRTFFSGLFAGSDDQGPGSGAGGEINVAAERVLVRDGGGIAASASGDGRAGSVKVDADEAVTVSGWRSGLFASGGSGHVAVNTPRLSIDDQGVISVRGGRGSVMLEAGEVSLTGGGQVDAETESTRDAGDITVVADSITIAGTGGKPGGDTLFSGLFARSDAEEPDGGVGGAISIHANRLTVRDSGGVSAASFHSREGGRRGGTVEAVIEGTLFMSGGFLGTGGGGGLDEDFGAGSVEIVAGRLMMADRAEILARGTQGSIALDIGELILTGGSTVQVSSIGVGQGGNIEVAAGSIHISGAGRRSRDGREITSSLRADSEAGEPGAGRGGEIWVDAGRIVLRDGGAIQGVTAGAGRGGDLVVRVRESITASGRGPGGAPSGLFTSSFDGSGDGGDIFLASPGIMLTDSGRISAMSTGSGEAGDIGIANTDRLILHGGSIETNASSASGGSIAIGVRNLIDLQDSRVITSVAAGRGSGGNIAIDPRFLILDRSVIQANALGGNGGNIDIRVGNLIRTPDSAIEATSTLGIDGKVAIDAPEPEVSGSFVVLPAAFIDASAQLPESCAARRSERVSSFTGIGRGGLPPGPDAPLPGFYALERGEEPVGGAAAEPASGSGSLPVTSASLVGFELDCRDWR